MLGPMELVLVVLVVVFIFGAKKLPMLGKGLGEAINNFVSALKKGDRSAGSIPDDTTPEKKEDPKR